MTSTNGSRTPGEAVPADIAAERAAIEAEAAGSTLLTTYAETVAAHGGTTAHRWKDDGGTWRSLTYRQVYDRVRDLALGLAAHGFGPGEFAAIWSGNRTEATVADYAVMHARGVPVFIYNTASAEQAAYIIGHCEATVAIVESRYLPRLLEIRDQLPRLRRIILIDGSPPDEGVIRYEDVLRAGTGEDTGQFEAMWRKVTPDDLATLIYTSGTTGTPKGVMIFHRNARFYQAAYARIVPPEDQADDDGIRLVSYLPMAHVTGRSIDHWSAMARPISLTYCPEVTKIIEYAGQVHPTGIMGIPRVWEKLYAGLSNALPTVDPAAIRALPDSERAGILEFIGLDKCKLAASGSAPLDPKIIEFFRALGVPLTEGWGMSELSNAATFARPDSARVGTVGRRFPGVEIEIAADGEVLVRGPLVMGGYYRDSERTGAAVDVHGWLHTGDIGELDADGYLKITDRKKELIITSGGKNISPALIEHHLQRHPLIGQACAIGDGHNYVTALLVLDPETAPAWGSAHGLPGLPLADLAAHPDVIAEVQRGVDEANSHLARVEQVRKFRLLGTEWTSDTGELTPTQKRRRKVIVDRYATEINELYA
jgi:long-chain acyl-CoA synthetase